MRVIKSVSILEQFQDGEVLVTDKTDPDWEPTMKKAAAIVTNRGGRTCHAAIVSRELGLPAIVGTENGTEVLQGRAAGDRLVRRGRNRLRLRRPPGFRGRAQSICASCARPNDEDHDERRQSGRGFPLSFIPNDGVGLAREEFIITNYIKIHPLALLDYRPARRIARPQTRDRST